MNETLSKQRRQQKQASARRKEREMLHHTIRTNTADTAMARALRSAIGES
jgi:hypothetical protein